MQAVEEQFLLNEYTKEVKEALSKERYTLHLKLINFQSLYVKMSTNEFYRLCSYTHYEHFTLPKNIPAQLHVAKTIYENIYYSSLVRTVLLFKEGYTGALIQEPNRPARIFQEIKDLNDLTLSEKRLELYKYLNLLLREVKPAVITKPQKNKIQTFEQRLEELERRINLLEKKKVK